MADRIFVRDEGGIITINLGITNIPITTDIVVVVQPPHGPSVEWVIEDGELNRTTGIITHKSKPEELPYDGDYQVQCIQLDTGIDTGSGIDYFKAFKRL